MSKNGFGKLDICGKCVLNYIDDILVYSRSLSEHVRDVESVLQILMKHKLFIKLKKCEMFSKSVAFLGHKLSAEGISVKNRK